MIPISVLDGKIAQIAKKNAEWAKIERLAEELRFHLEYGLCANPWGYDAKTSRKYFAKIMWAAFRGIIRTVL